MLHTYCINLSPIPFHPRFGILNESLGTSFEGRMLGKFWGDKLTNSSQKVATNMGIFTPRKLTAGHQTIGRFGSDVSPFPVGCIFSGSILVFSISGGVVFVKLCGVVIGRLAKGATKIYGYSPVPPTPVPRNKAFFWRGGRGSPPSSRNNPLWEWPPKTFLKDSGSAMLIGGFSPTHLKNMSVKLDHFPRDLGENKKYFSCHHLACRMDK